MELHKNHSKINKCKKIGIIISRMALKVIANVRIAYVKRAVRLQVKIIIKVKGIRKIK